MTTTDLHHALTLPRIPWAAIVAAGYSIEAIRDDAGEHGDHELVTRASRAMARR